MAASGSGKCSSPRQTSGSVASEPNVSPTNLESATAMFVRSAEDNFVACSTVAPTKPPDPRPPTASQQVLRTAQPPSDCQPDLDPSCSRTAMIRHELQPR